MEHIQSQKNKITTWWKKVFVVMSAYIFWFIISFGLFAFQQKNPNDFNHFFLDIISVLLLMISPLTAFWLAGKIVKFFNLNERIFYTIVTFITVLGLIIVFLIGLSNMRPQIG